MGRPQRGQSLSLTIDDLAFGGEGVGRTGGYVIFVRGGGHLLAEETPERIVEAIAGLVGP